MAYKAETTSYPGLLRRKITAPGLEHSEPALMAPGATVQSAERVPGGEQCRLRQGETMIWSKGITLAAMQTRMTAGKTPEG